VRRVVWVRKRPEGGISLLHDSVHFTACDPCDGDRVAESDCSSAQAHLLSQVQALVGPDGKNAIESMLASGQKASTGGNPTDVLVLLPLHKP